ncbi:hypothetical protein [Myxococcus qinghaiensis]|uniref:hypothetical protein n=1 Tax=Myxococcus qinghaiensis TaxID=2906758 RepID=UPI0020A6F0EA|nr:hypothetical protein [Myxococcus qinghaiensis]MCP3166311.1 hypothetical protein [Myxococcus qinghaiensis]
MRKGFQKWVFVVGVVVGGALGVLQPAQAEAGALLCQNLCTNEDCSCFFQCGMMGGQCVCADAMVCI